MEREECLLLYFGIFAFSIVWNVILSLLARKLPKFVNFCDYGIPIMAVAAGTFLVGVFTDGFQNTDLSYFLIIILGIGGISVIFPNLLIRNRIVDGEWTLSIDNYSQTAQTVQKKKDFKIVKNNWLGKRVSGNKKYFITAIIISGIVTINIIALTFANEGQSKNTISLFIWLAVSIGFWIAYFNSKKSKAPNNPFASLPKVEDIMRKEVKTTSNKFDPSKYRGNTPEDDRSIINALNERYLLTMWKNTVLEHGCVNIANVHLVEPGEDSIEALFNKSKQNK